MSQAIANKPNYGSFGSVLISAKDNNYIDGVGDYYHISGRVKRRGYGASKSNYLIESGDIFSPCAAAAIYRKDIFISSGGFDEDYFCYVEDVDLGFRFQLMGFKSFLVTSARVNHVGSGTTGGQKSDFSVYHGNRNLIWTYVKNMPGILFWICLPLHILFNMTSIFFYSLRGRGRIILTSKLDALTSLPKMWRKRIEIQRHSRISVYTAWRILDRRIWPK
jgi:GT2 family glycosyltransferase